MGVDVASADDTTDYIEARRQKAESGSVIRCATCMFVVRLDRLAHANGESRCKDLVPFRSNR